MKTPPLPADFIHPRVCKPICAKLLTLPNSEVEMWIKAGKIKINLQKGADIRALDKILATYILN